MKHNSRNFIGYGQQGANFKWLHGARLAINFIINYEAGAEQSPAHGDACSESYLTDIPSCVASEGERHLSSESIFEYESRCGIWRLHELFEQYQVPLTIFACGRALECNQPYCDYLRDSQHEVAGHGYRWINYHNVPLEMEREHIQKTIAIIEKQTAKKVYGYYTGRKSNNTISLYKDFNLLYHSDSYADDLPYRQADDKQTPLVIPYNLVTNDCRYATTPGFACAEQFYAELKSAFDFQYQQGKTKPQLLTIGLHPRFSGRPSRAQALKKFVDLISAQPDIWICTRADIARYFINV
ncbi:MAG: polysaccharide deacetylase family protein [Coxiellaceae bacterium]|nr:polysaccharide deacetylase family protein [Coxiellaceae bacterium]